MPKRKMSTFERLMTGRQKRNQRRELAQRIDKGDQCAFKFLRHGIDVVNPDTAGIDVGKATKAISWPCRRTGTPNRFRNSGRGPTI